MANGPSFSFANVLRYREKPLLNNAIVYRGRIRWLPSDGNPFIQFGAALEAFDALRWKYRSHITFNSTRSAFEVAADDARNGQCAERGVHEDCETLRAMHVRRVSELLVDFPESLNSQSRVTFGHHGFASLVQESNGQLFNQALQDSPSKIKAFSERSQWEASIERLRSKDWECCCKLLNNALDEISSLRCQALLRVHVGRYKFETFGQQYSGGQYSFTSFHSDVRSKKASGGVLQSIGHVSSAMRLVQRLSAASGSLSNAESLFITTTPWPRLTGRFVVQRPNNQLLHLEVTFAPEPLQDPPLYKKQTSFWKRTGQAHEVVPLRMTSVDIQGKCSWMLQLSCEQPADALARCDPTLKLFEDSIGLQNTNHHRAIFSGTNRFTIERHGQEFRHLQICFEQQLTMQYRFADDSDWIFEMNRFDTIVNGHRASKQPSKWTVTLWNSSWDEILAENATLRLGQRASWRPSLSTFFPSVRGGDSQGMHEFWTRMKWVKAFVATLMED